VNLKDYIKDALDNDPELKIEYDLLEGKYEEIRKDIENKIKEEIDDNL